MWRTASAERGEPIAGTGPSVPAIATSGLHKAYGRRVALYDLTLQVGAGEVFGFLGPNGAGKTTAMKILLGLIHPSGGQALVFGRPPTEPAARRRVGYLPEHFRFQEGATGAELLDFHGRLSGLGHTERAERIPEVLERVGLASRGGERVRRYSKGMTQLRLLLDRVDADLLALMGRYGQVARVEGTAVTLDVDALDVAPDLATVLVGSGYRLYGLVPVQRSLEDVFVDLVGEVRER